MNREELIDNLGTIARSGTAAFVKQLSGDAAKDMSLIGQFGVGFYSAFMVADEVEVRSRKAGDAEAWRWASDGKGEFTVEPLPDAGRGAAIVVHLREDEDEYLDPARLRQIVHTYSDHIGLPIVLEDGGKKETVNPAAALWMRPRAEITQEQYNEFYHHVGHSFDEPWLTLHNKAEGISNTPTSSSCPRPSRSTCSIPDAQEPGQALCPARLHHRRLDRAAAGLSALSARRRRQRGSAAQRQPRDAAEEPDGGANAPAAHAARA